MPFMRRRSSTPSSASKSRRNKGSVRRSQLITTYGVGSIVAVGDESVMVAGIDRWPVTQLDLHEPRLERQLRVQGFVLPPATDNGNDIPVVRFPFVYYCPSCRRLEKHNFFAGFDGNKCPSCNVPLVPSRFVVACSKGHIDDFPYFEWVHAGTMPSDERKHVLTIDAGGVSASLRDIVIKCSCGKSSTMQGSLARDALKGVKKCTGRRPWLGDKEDCGETPRALQRGASNVYFAVVRSALSIPPWSEGAYKLLNKYWTVLRVIPTDDGLRGTIVGLKLAEGTAYTVDDLVLAVKQRKEALDSGEQPGGEMDLRRQEHEALVLGKAEATRDQDFVCEAPDHPDPRLEEWFDKVMLVKRLREVRALQTFTRLTPPTPADKDNRPPLSSGPMDWLPAVEILGEGVFLRLSEARLQEWETRQDVRDRAEKINARYKAKFASVHAAPDRVITPRLLLVHSLLHILIDQWALESGYPDASLRERLYVAEDMAGLLIYTATSDAGGSLGGVVSQAEGTRLWEALLEAVARASWCSSDPLCIETDAAGVDSLNLAACHACILLPEVSCEESNVLLDRALLVGTPENPDLGFFASVVPEE